VLSWVIVGGESGPRARPCNVEWIRGVLRQCREAGVPAFCKQLGPKAFERVAMLGGGAAEDLLDEMAAAARRPWDGWTTIITKDTRFLQRSIKLNHPKGGDWDEWPADLRVREMP
jgi:hypothetical protein